MFYFPDLANGRIFTKQIGADGLAVITMYEQKELPVEMPQAAMENFVTKEELQSSLEELKKLIAQSKIVNNF